VRGDDEWKGIVTLRPKIVGIVNITEDSFSDGGRFLSSEAAIGHAGDLLANGADVIELGPASSNPEARMVSAAIQIERLAPVLDAILAKGIAVSVDATDPTVQRFALSSGAAYLNDIRGFPDPVMHEELARSSCRLIAMHSVTVGETASLVDTDPTTVFDGILRFFDRLLVRMAAHGIRRDRLIVDPGMGFFLGTDPETSLAVLRRIPELRSRFGLPVMISVSRKSFLRNITGRTAERAGAATLAAELFAWEQGADYIRTHDPGALRDAIRVLQRLRA
jgi:dihydropteroate synthase type 2